MTVSGNSVQPVAQLTCPVCKVQLDIRPGEGRKSHKLCIVIVCPVNGKHFRGFIMGQDYVGEVFGHLDRRP